jgi:SAM-dependent methyltransferase
MTFEPIKKIKKPNLNTIEFYDEIAITYDALLDREFRNKIVRKRVEEKFTNTVKPGYILDFGGGTGRDLEWLIDNQYKVLFCEPSEGMRKRAIEQYKDIPAEQVTFLEKDQTDFTSWNVHLPYPLKTEGILSDFAVLNCIADIELLFKNLALMIKPGGHLIALMLNHQYKKTWPRKIYESVRNLFSGKPVILNVQYNGYKQIVYIYSLRNIKKASSAYFDMYSRENIFEFTLFDFIGK